MLHWLLYLSILKVLGPALSEISVNKVVVRTPKDGDIGLIFDISIINTANEDKELLEYRIRPENECCINITDNSMIYNGGKILGGSFGQIEPGAMQSISIVWPTTAIFNRIGYCNITIISTNVKNEEKELSQQLLFDTRFTKIDPTGTTYRKRKEYTECSNWDMDFLNKCEPVDCEEKYLGRRNFYNTTTKLCEPAPKCSGKNLVYDIYANECTDLSKLMDPEDIENIKIGKCGNASLQLSSKSLEPQHVEARSANQDSVSLSSDEANKDTMWPDLLSGLSIVLATIVIYTTVCFFIFLLVNWLSKISARPNAPIIISNRSKD